MLDTQSNLTIDYLSSLSGPAFDREYLESQIMAHEARQEAQALLDAL